MSCEHRTQLNAKKSVDRDHSLCIFNHGGSRLGDFDLFVSPCLWYVLARVPALLVLTGNRWPCWDGVGMVNPLLLCNDGCFIYG